jgi:hypothetical protein
MELLHFCVALTLMLSPRAGNGKTLLNVRELSRLRFLRRAIRGDVFIVRGRISSLNDSYSISIYSMHMINTKSKGSTVCNVREYR